MRYFYNAKTKLSIADVSGKKTTAEISSEFGGVYNDYQSLELTPAEEKTSFATIENNTLVKKILPPPYDVKSDYAKLATMNEKVDFIAKRLSLQ